MLPRQLLATPFGIADWKAQEMTICIAAICDEGRAIINVGDGEVGVGFTAGELGRTKWDDLCKDWTVGFAGTVSSYTETIEWVRTLVPPMQSTSAFAVRSLLEKSYRSARLARIEAEHLASRGWTLQEFKDHGAAKLPETTYATIDARIAIFDYGAELIAAGYGDDDDYPTILTVENPGLCIDHSRLGFWCIGSGSTAAQMSLFGRNYSPDMSVEEAVYYVVEAKINAEHAIGVGRRTDTFVIRKGDEDPKALTEAANDELRAIWETLRPRDFDHSHRDAVKKIIKKKSR